MGSVYFTVNIYRGIKVSKSQKIFKKYLNKFNVKKNKIKAGIMNAKTQVYLFWIENKYCICNIIDVLGIALYLTGIIMIIKIPIW